MAKPEPDGAQMQEQIAQQQADMPASPRPLPPLVKPAEQRCAQLWLKRSKRCDTRQRPSWLRPARLPKRPLQI